MRQALLRRGLIAVLGFAALLFATLGTQPSTTASAADIFSNVGCTYGDYSCLYARNGYNTYATYGYPTAYTPTYTTYPYNYGNYGYSPYTYAYSYAPVYNYGYSYTPAFYGFGYQNYYYGYGYGYVPPRFFTRVGCPVGNFSCVRGK